MRQIKVINTLSDYSATVDYMDVADLLDEWNEGDPAEVWDAITELQAAINAHEPTTELEEYLAIRLQQV